MSWVRRCEPLRCNAVGALTNGQPGTWNWPAERTPLWAASQAATYPCSGTSFRFQPTRPGPDSGASNELLSCCHLILKKKV